MSDPAAHKEITSQAGFQHGAPSRTAILLVNLGTPAAPTTQAVRRYLAQFLSDSRVVEIPRWIWKIILHGIVLRIRPAKSAKKYAAIWTAEGSPLQVFTEKQAKLLHGFLGARGLHVDVAYAMRYGEPAIAQVLQQLRERNTERVLLVPLYPQYSAATTATVCDEVGRWMQQTRNQPELRSIKHFHDDPRYLDALAQRIKDDWQQNGWPDFEHGDRLLMSFHGMPKQTLLAGDPYHCECHKTARLLAQRLRLQPAHYAVAFQSRFGKAEWLQPYTTVILKNWVQKGARRVDVVCPGFVSDCLETLEEINIEARELFAQFGGRTFRYIPCLNDAEIWIHALADICQQHMQGWLTEKITNPQTQLERDHALKESRQRALGMGAHQ